MVVIPARPASASSPRIVIDPGHGGADPGAINRNYSYAGKPYLAESDINLDIAWRANVMLQGQGFRTHMTRESDIEPLTPMRDIETWNRDPDGVFRFYADGAVTSKDSLQARVNIANCARQHPSCAPGDPNQADAFVSIHNNSCGGCGGEGTETYSYPGSSQGAALASLIQEEVVKRIGRRNRGAKVAACCYQLHWIRMAGALLEGAFIDNNTEAQLLLDPNFRNQIAEGVTAGVIRYFNVITLAVAPGARSTLAVGSIPGFLGVDVASEISSDQPVVAERSMYFTPPPTGGTGSAGSAAPSTSWYFAEGATHSGFATFILVSNPSGSTADLNLKFMTGAGSTSSANLSVGSGKRRTISLNTLVPGADVSTVVTSNVPVVAERAMYSSGPAGEGHTSPGAAALSNTWYFAEGYTGPGFFTFLLLANPGSGPAQATIDLLREGGGSISTHVEIPAGSRRTVAVNDLAPGAGMGAAISSDQPIVAERSVYAEPPYKGATNVVGASSLATTWHFAEGFTGGGYTTFLLVANPSDLEAQVEVRLAAPDLPQPLVVPMLVPARGRASLAENTLLPGREISATVTSLGGVPIIAERAVYFSGPVTGAHASLGASPSTVWYFAEGSTAGGYSTFLLFYNPGPNVATVTVRLLRS